MSDLPTIEEKAVELIEKFEQLAADVAPQAVDLGLAAARVAAAQDILLLLVCVVMVLTSIPFTIRALDRLRETDETVDFVKTLGGALASAMFGIGAVVNLSIWPFVGVFYPELWIAKQVLGW